MPFDCSNACSLLFYYFFFGCLEVNVLNGTGNATRYDWCMKYQRIQYLDQFHIFEDKSTGTHFLPIKVIFNSKTQFSGTLFYSALPLEKTTPSSMFQKSHLSSAVFSHILRVLNVDCRKACMSAKCSLNDSASPQFSCLLRYWCTSMPIIRMSGDVSRVFETNISNAFKVKKYKKDNSWIFCNFCYCRVSILLYRLV